MSTQPFIHLAGVAKTYGKGAKAHLAISDATFDVMPGELARHDVEGGVGDRQVRLGALAVGLGDAGEMDEGLGAHRPAASSLARRARRRRARAPARCRRAACR